MKSAPKGMDSEFELIISSVLHHDNATRRAAEQAFNRIKTEHPEFLMTQLMSLLLSSSDELVRARARARRRGLGRRCDNGAALRSASPSSALAAHGHPAHPPDVIRDCAPRAGAHVVRRARAAAGGGAIRPAWLGEPRLHQSCAPALGRGRAQCRRPAQGVRRDRPTRVRAPPNGGVA